MRAWRSCSQGCRSLVVTATEEFGIAAVEAQAAGRPVIAPDEGGARETVDDGVTGRLYAAGSHQALTAALGDFDPLAVDPDACVAAAARFDVTRFTHGVAHRRGRRDRVGPAGAARRAPAPRRRGCSRRRESGCRHPQLERPPVAGRLP